MGILVYSLLWVMQDLYHQQYEPLREPSTPNPEDQNAKSKGFIGFRISP